jgi:hypothetical protein
MFRCRTAFSVALVLFLLSAVGAHGQIGVYGTVTGERVGGFTCRVTGGQCASAGGVAKPYGSSFGGYYDFRSIGPIRLGVDVRGSVLNSNKSAVTDNSSVDFARFYSALAGVRGEFRTPAKWLHPYAQVSAGLGRSNADFPASAEFPNGSSRNYQNFTQVEGFVGADITLLPILDLRALELGAGEMFGPSNHSIQSIGIGIVFHTPRR